MKKSILLIFLVILCAALLASCGCKHETWNDANCETAKTCAECGKTEGEPLGHTWADATCVQAKTCSVCGKTEGDALGHTWTDAACETPKTCQTCSLTEGEALGHTWLDATTEAPKTCSVCDKTEGERIITDSRFTTAACQDLFGSWVMTVPMTGDMMDMEGFTGVLDVNVFMEFSNDGKISIYTRVDKPDDFDAALRQYMIDTIYKDFEQAGVKKEDVNAQMVASVNMTVEEYVDSILKVIDFSAMFEMLDMEGCYYVADSQIFAGESWEDEMTPTSFKFVDGKLVVKEINDSFGLTVGGFSRVEEDET